MNDIQKRHNIYQAALEIAKGYDNRVTLGDMLYEAMTAPYERDSTHTKLIDEFPELMSVMEEDTDKTKYTSEVAIGYVRSVLEKAINLIRPKLARYTLKDTLIAGLKAKHYDSEDSETIADSIVEFTGSDDEGFSDQTSKERMVELIEIMYTIYC